MDASLEAPDFFLAASMAFSAESIATLKNLNDGVSITGPRHWLPSEVVPVVVTCTTHPAADALSVMHGSMRRAVPARNRRHEVIKSN